MRYRNSKRKKKNSQCAGASELCQLVPMETKSIKTGLTIALNLVILFYFFKRHEKRGGHRRVSLGAVYF
jgi:hypothetical protein